jgi:hypothetical protein
MEGIWKNVHKRTIFTFHHPKLQTYVSAVALVLFGLAGN